jgi:hypothetical protein
MGDALALGGRRLFFKPNNQPIVGSVDARGAFEKRRCRVIMRGDDVILLFGAVNGAKKK